MPIVPSFRNELQLEEVSLALEHVLVAPYGTAWSPARVEVNSPPPGFVHLGAVQDDSPSVQVSKEMYTLDTGIPAVRNYQAVTRIMGEFSFVLHSHAPYPNYLGAGGLAPYYIPQTANAGYMSVASLISKTQLLLNSVTADLQVTSMIVVDTTANLQTSRNYAWISAIDTSTKIITLSGPEGLKLTTPVSSMPLCAVQRGSLLLGSNAIPKFHILGVADFLDGAQVVHDMPNAQARGNWAEALRNGQDPRVQCTFDLLGYTVSTPYSTAGQVAMLERHWFPPTTVA